MKHNKFVSEEKISEKQPGIFDRLLFLHLLSTTILFLIIVASYYYIEKNSFNNNLMKKSILIRDILEISSVDPVVSTIAYDRINQAIETLYNKNQEIVYIEIYDQTAHIIAFVGDIPKVHISIEEINQLFRKDSLSNHQTDINQDYNELMTFLNIGDRHLGLIRLGLTRKYLHEQLRKNIQYFLGLFIIAIAITSLIFYIFTNKWIVVPIINVSKIMKNFGHDELPTLFNNIKEHNKSIRKDEIGTMSTTFEWMISSIIKRTTEKEKAEEKLRKSEERLKAIFEANPDPVVVYDVNGYPLYLNPAFTEIFRWTVNELQGRRIPFVPEDQEKLTNVKIKEIYKSGNPVRFETKRFSKHGETIDVLLSAAIIKSLQGINTGLVVNLTDITEQKNIEDQLRQSQKMEAIGTLAGGIAHDFNNILSGIFGYTQLAEMHINNPEKSKKDLDQVVKGAERAAELVQQILTFSRQVEYKKNPLELFFIVKEAIKFLRSSIPTTIEIQESISSRALVLANSTQIHQVVINLCTNAYHAMSDSGGILSVELNDVEVKPQSDSMDSASKPGNYVKLEVRDTGHGMDKKALERIFDPYFTTKDVDKGTGLGLAVVDGIVKKHNGFIRIYSKIGHGSTFQVFWPIIAKEESNNSFEKKKTGLAKGTEQIMLVDDETDIIVTSQAILERQGYKVTVFKDGLSALQAFTKDPDFFDLVITDMTMPQMTGDELATKILKIRQKIPIILCTGFSETMSEEKAASMGIKGFLLKPMAMRDLSQKVRDVLDK